MKVPNTDSDVPGRDVSLSRLQNEGSQHPAYAVERMAKSIKATE